MAVMSSVDDEERA